MKESAESEELFVRYLLGELPEADQARLEEVYFADDGYFEQLLVAEDELKYTYAQGLLEPGQRERFEARFAARPDRRGSLAFATELIWVLSARGEEQQQPASRFPEAAAGRFAEWRRRLASSWRQSVRPRVIAYGSQLTRVRPTANWSQLRRLSLGANRERLARLRPWATRNRPARIRPKVTRARLARIALVFVGIIFAVGLFAIVEETLRYHFQVRRLTQSLSKDQGYWSQIEQEKRRASSLAEELEIERSRRLELEEEATRRNKPVSQKVESQKVEAGSVASFIISPRLIRDTGEVRKPILQSGDAQRLRLQLKLERAGEFHSFEALLKTAEGRLVSGQAGLQPARLGPIYIIALTLPAKIVPPGDYHLELKGLGPGRLAEQVDDYYFSVAKRE